MTHWSTMLVSDAEKANEVMKALSDEYSRRIVLSITSRSMTVEEIAKEQRIPTSTCYRRVHTLLSRGVIRVDRTIISDDGKKYACYISCFRNATIKLVSGELKVDVVVTDASDRLHEMWSSIRATAPEHNKTTAQAPLITA